MQKLILKPQVGVYFGRFRGNARRAAPGNPILLQTTPKFLFFHVVSRYAKNSKIGPKKNWAGPPLLKGNMKPLRDANYQTFTILLLEIYVRRYISNALIRIW